MTLEEFVQKQKNLLDEFEHCHRRYQCNVWPDETPKDGSLYDATIAQWTERFEDWRMERKE